jgi:hypothetical protein
MKLVALLESEVGYTLQDEELIFDEFREPELHHSGEGGSGLEIG